MIPIGNYIGRKATNSSWNPAKTLGGETPDKWFTARSSGNLIDSLGGAAMAIQTPYLYKALNTEYALVADNGALDIGNTYDFAMMCKVKQETAVSTTYSLCGKGVSGGKNGQYSFGVATTTNIIFAQVQSSGGQAAVLSVVDFLATSDWLYLYMDVDVTNKILRFFINGIQIGVDTSYTGTFAALANAYEFYIGAQNNSTGTTIANICRASFADVVLYRRRLTAPEIANTLLDIYPSDTLAHWDSVLRANNILYDFSGNNYHMTGTLLEKATNLKYGSGSHHSLNVGYTRYVDFPNKDIFVGLKDNGTELAGVSFAGYVKDANYNGSLTAHNGADSYVTITGLDRSNTTICSYLATATDIQHYYDSTNKSWMHFNELYNIQLGNYFNDNYRGLQFTKITGRLLTDYYTYTINKIGTDYDKPIIYSGETNVLKFNISLENYICAVSGTRILKFDGINTLLLSNDSGATYPIVLITTLNSIDDAFFYDNGNIGFSDSTKCYYSTDNLATYHEATVLDIAGNPYVATGQDFRCYNCDFGEVIHDGVKLRSWGCYGTAIATADVNINQWETIDGGVNIKSVYKFGVSLPSLIARHIHTVKYDSISNTFFMSTGDATVGFDKNNIMQGTRNGGTGVWTWTLLGKGQAATVWANDGIEFDDTYIYLANEGAAGGLGGIRRFIRADIANIATNQEAIFKPEGWMGGVVKNNIFYVMTHAGVSDRITYSQDEISFITRRFPQIVVDATYGGYICKGYLANGYFLFICFETGETLDNYPIGSALLIKPSVII